MIIWHFGPLWGHISTPRGRKTPPILSNFKCQCQPPRLVWSASPSGYDLPRYPPVMWWGVHFIFFQSVLWETPYCAYKKKIRCPNFPSQIPQLYCIHQSRGWGSWLGRRFQACIHHCFYEVQRNPWALTKQNHRLKIHPICAIFLKIWGFQNIKHGIPS